MTIAGCEMGDACLPSRCGGGGVCADGCMTDADGRAEYACREVSGFPGRMYGAPACANDTECTVSGFVCNPGAGTCAVPRHATRARRRASAGQRRRCVHPRG